MRLYPDAVVIIYAVERMEPWAQLVAARMTGAQVASVTSELSCEGLPQSSQKYGRITSNTSGSRGVVALWSR